jgi:SH3-like domain-containing protein
MVLRKITFPICLGLLVIVAISCNRSTEQVTVTPSAPVATNTPAKNGVVISSTAPVEHFSISSANQTLPEDVLREIAYYPQGGPGGLLCDATCYSAAREASQNPPFLASDHNKIALGKNLEVCVCGQQPDEPTKVALRFPNNIRVLQEDPLRKFELEDKYGYYIHFTYRTQMDDPSGYYTFTLEEGMDSAVQHSVYVTTTPRLYRENNVVSLYHFQPNERIRLFAYESHYDKDAEYAPSGYGVLVGWQEYQVDAEGQLTIEVESVDHFVVIGDISGGVAEFQNGYINDDGVYSLFVEANSSDGNVAIQDRLGSDVDIVGYASPDTRMRVIGERWGWWLVRLQDGTEGWVESSDVKRVEIAKLPTPTDEEEPASSCPGAPPQRVRVGGTAKVCTAHDRLIVRTQPKRGASEITCLDPNTRVTVIDGPICADDWSWWKIETRSGVSGWVSEGGDEVDPYFICPAE